MLKPELSVYLNKDELEFLLKALKKYIRNYHPEKLSEEEENNLLYKLKNAK